MKKIIASIAIILAAGMMTLASAQNNNGPRRNQERPSKEQFAQMRMERMCEELSLDDKTSALFKEVYAQFLADQNAIMTEYRMDRKKEGERMTDQEVDADIRRDFERSRKLLDLRENYYEKFLKILTPRQIRKMYAAEKQMGQRASMHSHGPTQRRG